MQHALIIALIIMWASRASGTEPVDPTEIRSAKFYRSPEERREAGLGRQVTDWLKVSGLVEAETERKEDEFHNNIPNATINESTENLQLGLDIDIWENIKAELVLDYEASTRHSELDEGYVEFDFEPWGIEAGRLHVPFGEYYSHFVSDPMVEFGETRGNTLVVDYTFKDIFQVSVFALDGDADKLGDKNQIDWGVGLELHNEDESIKIGAGILSDLADTDELLLEDTENKYTRRVPGFNAFALIGMENFEITAELTVAMRSFRDLESDINKPRAVNVELAWFPRPSYQFAVRLEASDELEDQPEYQVGASFIWLLGQHVTFGIDYLYGEFKDNFAFDDNDNEIDSRSQLAAQFAIEF